jgi:hypothetical protein
MNFKVLIATVSMVLSAQVFAQGDLQRITTIGDTKTNLCEGLKAQAKIDNRARQITFGSCTCASAQLKNGAPGRECVLYYTKK